MPTETEIKIRCQRCGKAHELWIKGIPATNDDPSEEYVEDRTCDCGCYITEQDEDATGIHDLLEEFTLTKEGFLFDEDENRHVKCGDILDASEELKYFIKSEKPKDFEPFKLWDGRDVKP